MKTQHYPLVSLPGEPYTVPGREGLRRVRQVIRQALSRDLDDLQVTQRGKDCWIANVYAYGEGLGSVVIERRVRADFEEEVAS